MLFAVHSSFEEERKMFSSVSFISPVPADAVNGSTLVERPESGHRIALSPKHVGALNLFELLFS